jgi:hypothetical protein
LQLRVDLDDRRACQAEVVGERACGRQLRAGDEAPGSDRFAERGLEPSRSRARWIDREVQ